MRRLLNFARPSSDRIVSASAPEVLRSDVTKTPATDVTVPFPSFNPEVVGPVPTVQQTSGLELNARQEYMRPFMRTSVPGPESKNLLGNLNLIQVGKSFLRMEKNVLNML